MAKRIGEMHATESMKLEFELDKEHLGKDAVLVRASWWNNYHGDWEALEKILIPVDKIDEFTAILRKARPA